MPTIPLGPFDLTHPLGKGGMGVVWAGRHRAQRTPVAVKVVMPRSADDTWLAAFRSEVRAVAGLHHPHIVWVLDHGLVSDEASEVSDGQLVAGTPYLAMELAAGSLRERVARMDWAELRATLLALLDALGHAHARGVVHRDLKPANVLIGGTRPGVKLSDFGLVHLVDSGAVLQSGAESLSAGTPTYMAPEQFENRVADHGPWTDLYALGVLAWVLACGRPPFKRKGWLELLHAVVTEPPPPLVPVHPVPPGFEGWLRRMLQKDPADRFRRAADAAWSLLQLPEPVASAPAPPDSRVAMELLSLLPTQVLAGPPTPSRAAPVARAERPPLPLSWRRPAPAALPPSLLGAGLGLYGLRAVPVVGREAERDELWQALGEVEDGRCRGVLLSGPSGCGKSRLARWLCARGHEVGAATVLKALHGPVPGPHDGLGAMAARHLGGAADLVARLVARWPDATHAEREAVCALVGAEGAPPIERPAQRWAAAEVVVRRAAAERPVIAWLDDVQWGADALGFARLLLGQEVPVLLVLTARTEALAERALERRVLANLRPRLTAVDVPPLPQRHHADLVHALLGLSSPLADRVAERTAGNPLFAVQLVGDWVERGLLRVGSGGFELREGAEVALPDDLHAVWAARIDRLLAGRPDGDRAALEVAAALGQDVDRTEWAEVMAPSPGLLDALLGAQLAVPDTAAAWSFVHGMLRESLLRHASEAGRLAGHHRACADVLLRMEGGLCEERAAHHLLEAGDPERAVPLLVRASRVRFDAGEARVAEALAERALAVLDGLGAPEGDPRRAEAGLELGSALRLRGALDEAIATARRVAEIAGRHGHAHLVGRARFSVGFGLHMSGDLEGAAAELERAAVGADDELAVLVQMRLALVECDRGYLERAEILATRALDVFLAQGRDLAAGNALVGLAGVALRRGRLDDAIGFAERARQHFEASGSRLAVADANNYLGETTRLRGDLEQAEAHYRAGLELYAAMGAADVLLPRINLGLVQLARGRFAEASAGLERCLVACEEQRRPHIAGGICAFLLGSATGTGDWAAAEAYAARAAALLAETGFVDVDVARAAEDAGGRAAEAGCHELARAAWSIARGQWAALKRVADVARVDARLGR